MQTKIDEIEKLILGESFRGNKKKDCANKCDAMIGILEDMERAFGYLHDIQKMTKAEQCDLPFRIKECMLNLLIMKKESEGSDYAHEVKEMTALWERGNKGGLMH